MLAKLVHDIKGYKISRNLASTHLNCAVIFIIVRLCLCDFALGIIYSGLILFLSTIQFAHGVLNGLIHGLINEGELHARLRRDVSKNIRL